MTHITESNGKSAGQKMSKPAAEVNNKPKEDELVLPPPPDGGWGWVVVFASFMIHIMTDGVTYSYGTIQSEIQKSFSTTEEAAAWISSLLAGVTYCSGPFSSFLVNKFGCQLVTIAGTLLASSSLLASYWAPSLQMLYATAGIGTGLGFGLIYLPAIVSVTVYFEKYRSLATGIAVCGSGVGTFVFAPFISKLVKYFGGYKYPMMILSAIVLNCIIFGIMFRPLKPVKSSECIPLKVQNNLEVTKNNSNLDVEKVERNSSPLSFHQVASKKDSSNSKSSNLDGSNNIRLALSQPILTRDPFTRASCGSGIMNRSDVFLRSSIHSIRKRSGSLNDSEENVRFRLSLRSLPNGTSHKAAEGTVVSQNDAEEDNILKKMLQFSLLKDPLFIIFTVSNFLTSLGFLIPYVFLKKQAILEGIDEDSATFLVSIVGISNTFGRIVLGYVSDKPWINRLLVYNVCLTVCGVATIICSYCHTFLAFAIYSTFYGFFIGAYVGLTSVCLVDLVGLDKLTNGFGLVLLAQGIATFLGPPIAGSLFDKYKSYVPVDWFAGGTLAISGVMLFIIPPIQRSLLKKNEQLQRVDTIA